MDGGHGETHDGSIGGSLQLHLLDGFELVCRGASIALQPKAQQLLAFLALHERPVPRALVASTLWMDATESRAQASLRSALWRLRDSGCPVHERQGGRLQLADSVDVDARRALEQARRLTAHGDELEPRDEAVEHLQALLLPGWWEEWVLVERERLRQLQLHALERLAQRLAAMGRIAQALDAALLAVLAEPLRESAQRLVISIHLAEGNHSEALRQYQTYCALLDDELGIRPSGQMVDLVTGLGAREGGADQLVTQR